MGYRPDNPAGDALRRQQAVVQHPPLSTWGGEFPMTPQLKTIHFWADVSGGLDVLPVMPVGRFGLDEGRSDRRPSPDGRRGHVGWCHDIAYRRRRSDAARRR